MVPSTVSAFSLALLLLSILYAAVYWLSPTRRPSRYPPGPPGILGLGNLHQIPPLRSWVKLDEWATQYGPIMGLKLGHLNAVVLNDASLIYELMVKRANSFSERPGIYVAQHHVFPESQNAYSLYMKNDYNLRLRSMSKHFLIGSGLSKTAPLQKASATRLVSDIYQSSDEWEEHLKPWAVATPVAIMTGASLQSLIQDLGREWINDWFDSQLMWFELLDPTSPPVGFFPALGWLPIRFAQWKRKALIARKRLLDAYSGLVVQAQKTLQRQGGTITAVSIIPQLLRQASDCFMGDTGLDMTVFMGGLFDAAVGSSVMSFHTLTLALAAQPEVQRKAQAEIDSVFGQEGVPDHIDLEKLPYLYACALEAQRWRPLGAYTVGPFGLPRETMREEEVLGYRIPRGSWLLINQWSVAHDPDFYEDPASYNPDRYMQNPAGAKPGVWQQGRKPVYTFGAGRRECLGRDYYFQGIRIAFAQLLWAFDIVPDGPLDLDPKTGFSPAIVLMPKPFKVKFVPRRSGEVLRAEQHKADEKLCELLGD